MYLGTPSILNYNIASCYLQIVNFDEYAELHHVIIDIISSAIMLWII
jgi:hypothetical protein